VAARNWRRVNLFPIGVEELSAISYQLLVSTPYTVDGCNMGF
jgi:hypothetical protein